MNEQIKVGDLVMVVRGVPCCGRHTGAEGLPFTVERIRTVPHQVCDYCGNSLRDEPAALGFPGRSAITLTRLIKIDPPALDETTDERQELTA